jgi:hypothetical protein
MGVDDAVNASLRWLVIIQVSFFSGDCVNDDSKRIISSSTGEVMSFPPRLPVMATHCQKKIKADDLSIRSQYQVACGADVVIGHVLPYLISVVD